ncbi:hypothetical protein HZ326_17695, partial [Fusarium oxysporum f. sp. albedinis]
MTVPSPVSVSVWAASNFLPAKAMAVSPLILTTGSSCIRRRGRGYLYNRVHQLLQKQWMHLFKKSRLPPFSSPPRNITTSTFGSSLAFTSRRTFSSFYSSNSKMSSEEITHPTIKVQSLGLIATQWRWPRLFNLRFPSIQQDLCIHSNSLRVFNSCRQKLTFSSDGWFREISDMWPGHAMTLRVEKVLVHEKSKYQ